VPSPFEPDEVPTKPEGYHAVLRQMAERLRAMPPGDLAVIQMLREASTNSDADMARYMSACLRLVERLLLG
jgi:hypothetical protein